MALVSFNPSDFKRRVADSADIVLKNRYFEQNPALTEDGATLISRPGLRRLVDVGDGPIRGIASEPGSFGGDLFVASGDAMWRVDNKLVKTNIFSGLFKPERGVVRIAITGTIGATPEYAFFADGRNLLVYSGGGYAQNVLTGTVADNDNVVIGTTHYRFTTGSVNAGTPAGTLANPWWVKIGVSPIFTFTNLANAVNATGLPGTDYSTLLTINTLAVATSYTTTNCSVRAKVVGVAGNTVVTTETGAALSWTNGATMTGGGAANTTQVLMPEAVGAIDVAVINSYVIVVPVQSNGYQGRFYWIEPGETTVDPLNFATAERSPDAIFGVQVFGDQFWLPGEKTTEVWYTTGDATAPMRRLQGVVLDRGSWDNTPRAVHESLMLVDPDGGVFLVRGSSPQRVSTPNIEEQIRRAISAQQNNILL